MEGTEKNLELIQKYFDDFTDTQLRQLSMLGPLYAEWNAKINVISRKDQDALYERHILHSLSIAAVFDLPAQAMVLDLGTGGGFPGIPLAIFFPSAHFHLVDSIGKKIKVVQAVADAIGLQNVTVRCERVEEIKNQKFDVVVSRAVAPLRELWKWSKPLLNKRLHGTEDFRGLICLKGGDLADEVSDSGLRPRIIEITEIFEEPFFREKFILAIAD